MQASLACVVNGTPEIPDVKALGGKDGKEVVSQGRNLSLFQQKALRVRRVFDEPRNTVVYVAYSTRLTSAQDEGGASTGRYKCAPTFLRPRASFCATNSGVLCLQRRHRATAVIDCDSICEHWCAGRRSVQCRSPHRLLRECARCLPRTTLRCGLHR